VHRLIIYRVHCTVDFVLIIVFLIKLLITDTIIGMHLVNLNKYKTLIVFNTYAYFICIVNIIIFIQIYNLYIYLLLCLKS